MIAPLVSPSSGNVAMSDVVGQLARRHRPDARPMQDVRGRLGRLRAAARRCCRRPPTSGRRGAGARPSRRERVAVGPPSGPSGSARSRGSARGSAIARHGARVGARVGTRSSRPRRRSHRRRSSGRGRQEDRTSATTPARATQQAEAMGDGNPAAPASVADAGAQRRRRWSATARRWRRSGRSSLGPLQRRRSRARPAPASGACVRQQACLARTMSTGSRRRPAAHQRARCGRR